MNNSESKYAWLWDERGDLAYRLGQLHDFELKEYKEIQRIKNNAKCVVCGDIACYHNVSVKNGDWLCWKHVDDNNIFEYDYYEFII